jgi:hypothetical protein
MRRAGIRSLPEYEELLARLFKAHIPHEVMVELADPHRTRLVDR